MSDRSSPPGRKKACSQNRSMGLGHASFVLLARDGSYCHCGGLDS